MTPKEKAEQVIAKYSIMVNISFIEHSIPTVIRGLMLRKSAIQCALIAVDELLNNGNLYNNYNYPKDVKIEETIYYWIAIKQEIEEL
jgi:hypothetical protein